jgi:hypothetical protein
VGGGIVDSPSIKGFSRNPSAKKMNLAEKNGAQHCLNKLFPWLPLDKKSLATYRHPVDIFSSFCVLLHS